MTEYAITVEGFETGLTKGAIEDMFESYFPDADSVKVSEQE